MPCLAAKREAIPKRKSKEESAGDMGTEGKAKAEETEIQVFIAASLNTVMTELAKEYQKDHPNVKIIYNADSSGTLRRRLKKDMNAIFLFGSSETDGCLKQTDFL